MNKDNLNISSIETYLYSIIDTTVSNNTYVGELPDVIQSSWTDMCLIDVANAVKDFDAYGSGLVNIFLYARPMQSGSKNVAVMSKLEKALNAVISSAVSDTYHINRAHTYSDYDSDRKWHCNIVTLNITIV